MRLNKKITKILNKFWKISILIPCISLVSSVVACNNITKEESKPLNKYEKFLSSTYDLEWKNPNLLEHYTKPKWWLPSVNKNDPHTYLYNNKKVIKLLESKQNIELVKTIDFKLNKESPRIIKSIWNNSEERLLPFDVSFEFQNGNTNVDIIGSFPEGNDKSYHENKKSVTFNDLNENHNWVIEQYQKIENQHLIWKFIKRILKIIIY
ncbi:hypothetical protein GE118_03130 [Mycoplasma sp. NEAQ87857]|uniref:hypothetical protein n=1 Tax=Mycoplasma sp. NEAQ87857 TaxID=2683967 RepID=UPI001318F542|nr:hypothetical protein [Mycoplasma sp. NEAQ87857]QGZ97783.1 hypothetical protein GE118_03130 [Mycoplasma sp. NEAQ87857]